MSDQTELLINDIAVKHGVVLGRDDPILILQTMNAKLMEENAKAQQLMLNQYKEDLEGVALRWGTDAKDKSERILNASLASSKEAMANLLHESVKATSMTLQNDIEHVLLQTDKALLRTERIALINLAAAALTFLAAGMILIGLFQ